MRVAGAESGKIIARTRNGARPNDHRTLFFIPSVWTEELQKKTQ
jgi:hypothetical protein